MFSAPRGLFRARGWLGLAAVLGAFVVQGCGSDPAATTSSSDSTSSGAGNGGSGGDGGAGAGATTGQGGTAGGTTSNGGGGTTTTTTTGGFDPEAGWTNFTASADTLKIHVSSATGNDLNDGLTPETAVKTLSAGVKLLRDGKPDWLLLKRGDLWNGGWLGRWKKSGKSAAEPMVISYYGDMALPRPQINTGDNGAITAYDSPNVVEPTNYLAIVGLHFYANKHDPSSPSYDAAAPANEGIRWLTKTDSLLIEDVLLEFYTGNITVQGSDKAPQTNITIRRSVLADAYQLDPAHSQGIYAEHVKGLVIEENVFDHNGWNSQVAKAYKTQFNHNAYLHSGCEDVVFRNNISARAASHGAQVRPGGEATGNLFVQNPLAMSYGLVFGGAKSTALGVSGEIADNVILESNDIGSAAGVRGYGIQLGNTVAVAVHDNVIAHNASADVQSGAAIQFSDGNYGVGLDGLTVNGNVIYDWHGGLQFDTSNKNGIDMMFYPVVYKNVVIKDNAVQTPGPGYLAMYFGGSVSSGVHLEENTYLSGSDMSKWFYVKPDALSLVQWSDASGETGAKAAEIKYMAPERTLGDYHGSLGKDGTTEAFLAEARKQARGHYLEEYTVKPPSDYIREGFTVVP